MDEPVKYRIKELPEETRPRERLLKLGVDALHERELIAVLLRTGSGKDNALELADRLLQYAEGMIRIR
jgi:DNA repair protein RadC